MSAENRAHERSSPGTNAAPIYQRITNDAKNGWRRQTPPIVESLNETFEHVIAKQGRSDNRTPS